MAQTAGKAIAKIPLVGDTEIDENLLAVGEIIEDSDGIIKLGKLSGMTSKQSSCVQPYVDNIRTIGDIYDKPLTLMFDADNVYIEAEAA